MTRIVVFGYQSLTDAERNQLREMNCKYIAKNPVIVVDEQYQHIAVTSDDENVFAEAQKAIMQLNIAGLQIEWFDEGDSKELLEQELLAKLSDTRKIN